LQQKEDLWSTLENTIDDLFFEPSNLFQRLPFIQHRHDLRESSRLQFKALLEGTVEGVIIMDARGLIRLINGAAKNIFEYSSEETLGKNVKMLMPEEHPRSHDTYVSNYLSTGKKKVIGIGREVSGRRKSGEEFPMDLAISEYQSGGDRLFVGIIRDISNRRRLEQEVLRISEQERRRVGQDLHDGLGQMLTGIGLISRSIANRMEDAGSPFAEDLFEMTDLVRDADRQARDIARGMVQVELDGDGMSVALRNLCKNVEKFFSISCTFVEDGNPEVPNSSIASNLFRIAQEAVSNAVKHGRASEVTVTIKGAENVLELLIEDNGVGFPETLKEERGMGVDIMGYRARVINARLSIQAEQGRGTMVRCVLSS